MKRRRFIVKAGGMLAAAGTATLVSAPKVIAQPKIQWRISTAYPPALDVQLGAAQRLARVVEEMSGGRFRIEVCAISRNTPPSRSSRRSSPAGPASPKARTTSS